MEVIVCGGGAAGLMAAITAAQNGNNVTLVEKNQKCARKVMITGKGRCNVTNNCDKETLIKNTLSNPKFLYSAFNAFDSSSTMEFFEKQGVALKTERGNRVFPTSDKACDIVDALVNRAKKSGVKIINDTVIKVIKENGEIKSVLLERGGELLCDKCIIATGGASYTGTGSTGDGFRFAKELGHTVKELSASLVPLKIREGFAEKMMGLSLKNVKLTVFCKGEKKPVFCEQGEMLFTHFGISGPLVLSASAHIDTAKKEYYCLLDMKPALDLNTLDNRILRDFSKNANKDFINSLGELLPAKMIPTVVKLCGIEGNTKVNQISKEQRTKLCSVIKGIEMNIIGTRPIEEAIITRGGVSVKEINSATMESKLIKGLYFAGEVIDVDAYTGGFNLQIAFSTGYLAGL